MLRRNLRSHVGNSARITPPYAGTSCPRPESAMECCYLALLRRMPGHKNRQRPTRAGVTQREAYGGRCGRRAWHIRAPYISTEAHSHDPRQRRVSPIRRVIGVGEGGPNETWFRARLIQTGTKPRFHLVPLFRRRNARPGIGRSNASGAWDARPGTGRSNASGAFDVLLQIPAE